MYQLICAIPTAIDCYTIVINSGLLNNPLKYLNTPASRFAIITDDNIATLYGEELHTNLLSAGLESYLFSFPHGEHHKTRATKEMLENQLFAHGLGRDSCVIALGGGVVTDIAGYLAATYCRGIPLIMMPTSLLGMVDASIGGKTGVNAPYGKNLIGCIYQPQLVLIDPQALKSLPIAEFVNGFVEMIKHGLIADNLFFEYLEYHVSKILALNFKIIERAIFESCRIKKKIVEEDEKEKGKRHLLNFGHTIGHALEYLTNYSITHGKAVAIGILVESYLSVQLGILNPNALDRIKKILRVCNISLHLQCRFSEQTMLDAMSLDKKSLRGQARFVILKTVGSCAEYQSQYCTHVDESLVRRALQWMNDDLCCN